ncbi:MAG: hypothetical protein JWN67_4867 [Actinomycetia bacterium]|nr:hypothetical protein [Actinomycetes bacterium]
MCIMCDGASRDEVLFGLHGKIERFGFAVQAVEGTELHPPWAYTIGLLDSFDHPELVMVGRPIEDAYRIVGAMADEVCDGRDIEPGELRIVPPDGLLSVNEVDPRHWEGTRFAMWVEYYAAVGADDLEPAALQVRRVVEADGTRLDTWSPDDPCRMNRAARRARAHRRR